MAWCGDCGTYVAPDDNTHDCGPGPLTEKGGQDGSRDNER